MRLGVLHEGPLERAADAPAFYEQARRLDPSLAPRALAALERLYRKLERWSDLAGVLDALAEAETRREERTGLLFVLAQLCEDRLAVPGRAAEAYGRVIDAIPGHPASLRALCRIAEGSESTDAELSRPAVAPPRRRRPGRPPAARCPAPDPGRAGGPRRTRRHAAEAPALRAGRRARPSPRAGRDPARRGRPGCRRGGGAARLRDRARCVRRRARRGSPPSSWRRVPTTTASGWSRRGPGVSPREGALPAAGEAFRAASADWAARGNGPPRPRQPSPRPSPATRRAGPPSTRCGPSTPGRATGAPGRASPISTCRGSRMRPAGPTLLEELGDVLETRVGNPAGAWKAWRRAFREAPSSERALAALERLAPDARRPRRDRPRSSRRPRRRRRGERQADLLLRVAVSRGIHARRRGRREPRRCAGPCWRRPAASDAIEGAESALPPQARARLLAWGAAAWKSTAGRGSACRPPASRRPTGWPRTTGRSLARSSGPTARRGTGKRSPSCCAPGPGRSRTRPSRRRSSSSWGRSWPGKLDRAADAEAAFREALALGLERHAAADLLLRLARMRTQEAGDPSAARAGLRADSRALPGPPPGHPRPPGHPPPRRGPRRLRRAPPRRGPAHRRRPPRRRRAPRGRPAFGARRAAQGRSRKALRGGPAARARPPGRDAGPLRRAGGQGDLAGVARLLDDATARMGPDGDPRELLRQLCRLGRARENLGDVEGALAAYQRAREIDGTSLPALKGLGALLVRGEAPGTRRCRCWRRSSPITATRSRRPRWP